MQFITNDYIVSIALVLAVLQVSYTCRQSADSPCSPSCLNGEGLVSLKYQAQAQAWILHLS